MRSFMLVLVPILAVGCGPRFRLKESQLTCGEPILTWAGGLINHVLQGNGNGEFAYAPASDVIELIDGDYDLKTGDFWWVEYYVDGAYKVQDYVVGYGTIWPDGDMDVEYDLEVDLADDRREDFFVREYRFGCDQERRVEHEDGRVEVYEGSFSDGELVYTHRWDDDVHVYDSVGARRPDGTWSEETDLQDGDLSYQLSDEGDLDLFWRRDFRRENGFTVLDGGWERDADGTLRASYSFVPANGADQTWNYELDFEGNGEGTYAYAQQNCALVFDEGECTASDCTKEGACEPPLTTDEVLVRF